MPDPLAGLFLLSPGAPVNNCRWASIQWIWDQWTSILCRVFRTGPLFIFSKGRERASAQAFFSYIKGWARRAQAYKQKFNS